MHGHDSSVGPVADKQCPLIFRRELAACAKLHSRRWDDATHENGAGAASVDQGPALALLPHEYILGNGDLKLPCLLL